MCCLYKFPKSSFRVIVRSLGAFSDSIRSSVIGSSSPKTPKSSSSSNSYLSDSPPLRWVLFLFQPRICVLRLSFHRFLTVFSTRVGACTVFLRSDYRRDISLFRHKSPVFLSAQAIFYRTQTVKTCAL